MRITWLGLLAPLLLLGGCDFNKDSQDKGAPTPQAAVAATQIDGDYLTTGGDGTNWAAIGFNYYGQRYSPLDAIDRANVGRLGVAWSADLPAGEVPQSTPIAADGKIYVTAPRSRVFAFDGATGKQLWSFDAGLTQPAEGRMAGGIGNQGLAIFKGRLYLATLDGQLIALDAITGAQLWSVQTGGTAGTYRITSTPRVVKNMVIIGSGRAGPGGRGYVSAYDATDGALRWRFYTVPGPDGTPDKASSDAVLGTAAQTWGGIGGSTGRGASAGGFVTDAISYDPDLDRLYVGVGAGPADAAGAGDRLFLSSIIALDPDDGEFLWQYQETPGARPAYGASQPFVLAELPMPRAASPAAAKTPGATPASARPTPSAAPCPSLAAPAGPKGDAIRRDLADCRARANANASPRPVPRRKVLLQASDNGFFFVIDRMSGKPIAATPLFAQPGWTDGYDLATGRPVRIGPADASAKTTQIARSLAPVAAPRPLFPPVDALRAPRWMSFNPGTGLAYFTLPSYAERKPAEPAPDAAGDAPPPAPQWSPDGARLIAFDPVAGEIRWSRDLTAARNSSPLSTAGGLLFVGTGIGRFVALDAATGAVLFNRDLGSGMAGAPSSFLVGGEQYVAVLTGLGGGFDWPAPAAGLDGSATPIRTDDGKAGKTSSAAKTPSAAGYWLRVPSVPRLVLMRLGADGRIAPVPRPVPSPTAQAAPTPAASPASEPRRP